jgi:hypothetical protein
VSKEETTGANRRKHSILRRTMQDAYSRQETKGVPGAIDGVGLYNSGPFGGRT